MNPFLATDGYKTGHHMMYPKETVTVYSNFTPRSNKYGPKGARKVVVFGPQMVMRQIYDMFDKEFFKKDKAEVCGEIKREYSMYLGTNYNVEHIAALHDLGYLPITVKSLPEGTLAPIGVPVLTIYNTKHEFFWLTNFLETLLSTLLWKPMTSATIARLYRSNLTKWAKMTDEDNIPFVSFQGHNFSMRGMDGLSSAINASLGHATSFLGDDTLSTIYAARKFYDAEGPVVHSVNATEHSVMCAGSKDDEIGTFRYLMEQFPTGILSIVSDTWDLWKVCTEYIVTLKDEILARDGKIVIRPDSGNPVDIICGDAIEITKLEHNSTGRAYPPNADQLESWDKTYRKDGKYYKLVGEATGKEWKEVEPTPANIGVIELLWNVFGGKKNEQGYRILDSHIGAIYGDSITIDRAEHICQRLEKKGFASTNVVLGIGSFTYQFNTRDTFGFAMKATYVELKETTDEIIPVLINEDEGGLGEAPATYKVIGREIFKDPITDDGTKKSAKGLLRVVEDDDGNYILEDQTDWEGEKDSALQTIFTNGQFENVVTFNTIRERIAKSLV